MNDRHQDINDTDINIDDMIIYIDDVDIHYIEDMETDTDYINVDIINTEI